MGLPTREEIQSKIDLIRGTNQIALADLAPQIGSWMDGLDLSLEGLDQSFMKKHILSDLNSYEGVI